MSASRADLLFMAQIAEQAERWDDMRGYMSRIAMLGQPLEVFERSMLSQAFKESLWLRAFRARLLRYGSLRWPVRASVMVEFVGVVGGPCRKISPLG